MSASENLPSIKYSKGVLDREFIIKCMKGFPKYNVKMTKKRTRTPEVLRLVNELQILKKRLFAYRLAHYDDTIGEIQGLSISGRALELTESALLLFNKYRSGPDDDKTLDDEILPTMSEFLKERLGRRNDRLEARLYPIITTLMAAQNGKDEFDNDTIFGFVQREMGGRELSGKPGVFYVDELSMTVTRTKIMKVLREKFKAIKTRIILADGSTTTGHKFSREALEQIKASYEDPWEVKIIPTEDPSDIVNIVNRVVDQDGEQKEEAISAQEPENHKENQVADTPNNVENGEKTPSDGGENSLPVSTGPSLPCLPSQSYSIEEIISKSMLDEQGNNKGHFTLQE